MKNLKKPAAVCAVLSLLVLLFVACEDKEEDPKPVISNVVAENHSGGSQIPLEGTISVEFDAEAKGDARLDFYHIEIHDHPVSGKVEDEYRIINDDFKNESTFTGLRNAHVHAHIDVPDTANLGTYHVVVTIVDTEGYSADTEGNTTEIEIIAQ